MFLRIRKIYTNHGINNQEQKSSWVGTHSHPQGFLFFFEYNLLSIHTRMSVDERRANW